MVADQTQQRSVYIVILGGFFLSTLGIGVRLMQAADSYQIVMYRSLGLALFMMGYLSWRYSGRLIYAFRQVGALGVVAGSLFAAASLSIVLALQHTTVANATFIISLTPFFSGLFAWLFLGERMSGTTWVAMAIAMTGVTIMVQGALSSEGLLGMFFALLMAIFYGLFSVCARATGGRDMTPSICWSGFFLAGVMMFMVDGYRIPAPDLALCLALGIFQVGLGGLCLIIGAKGVPAAQLTLLAMLEAALAPLWVWLGVGEVPSATTLLGGGFIFTAIAFQVVWPAWVGKRAR